MFRLSRLTDLKNTDTKREKRQVPEYVSDKLYHSPDEIKATVKFHNSVKWRLADDYENIDMNINEHGDITLNLTWSDTESFYRYIASFEDKAEIIAPEEYRKEFKSIIKKIYDKY